MKALHCMCIKSCALLLNKGAKMFGVLLKTEKILPIGTLYRALPL